ncbi:glycosyltransferase family 4 protein [Salibacteraceae bacterium]|nr:glycosyltransferase family 4 protein [Salibacteraceae bacterium]
MNFLILSDGIPPFIMGGMQKHSRLLVEYVARLGHSVTLFHYSEKLVSEHEMRSQFSEKALENITFHHFVYEDDCSLLGHYLRAQKRMSERYLAKLLQLGKFDFIYAKGFMGWALLNKKNRYGIKTSIGVKFHGMNMFQVQPNMKGELTKYLLRSPVKRIMNKADYVFSYGGKITEIIANELDDPTKIIEIPSGIERERMMEKDDINTREGVRKFLFVGRFDRLKGLPELYKAIQRIDVRQGFSFTIVGPIPEEKKMDNSAVTYTGEVNDVSALTKIYDDHDVLICPSFSEGMPNVIMEAMARGLAIIATDVGATSLLVSEENGILFKSPTPESIVIALNQMIDDSDERLTQRKMASRNRINEFVWESIGEKLNEAISLLQ